MTVDLGSSGRGEGTGGGGGPLFPLSVLLARKKMIAPRAISPTIHIGLFMPLLSNSDVI